jgi:hypothetical protein
MGRAQEKPIKRVRVRAKSLEQIDKTKLSLALWLMAKRLVEEREQDAAAGGAAKPTKRKAA